MKKLVTIFLLLPLAINAQSKFYLSPAVTAPVSPTFNSVWDVTTGVTRGMLYTSKSIYGNSNNSTSTSGSVSAATAQGLIQVFISQPLPAQTISSGSTITMQVKCGISSTSGSTGQLLVYFRWCDQDGTNIQEMGNATSTNMAVTNTNRTISLTLASNVVLTDWQRIIIEVGWNYSSGAAARTGSISNLFNPAVGDLPSDNVSTSILNPWVQFSQTINLFKSSFF